MEHQTEVDIVSWCTAWKHPIPLFKGYQCYFEADASACLALVLKADLARICLLFHRHESILEPSHCYCIPLMSLHTLLISLCPSIAATLADCTDSYKCCSWPHMLTLIPKPGWSSTFVWLVVKSVAGDRAPDISRYERIKLIFIIFKTEHKLWTWAIVDPS